MDVFQSEISEQSKLIELIRILKPEEKAQIVQFASLPMFNCGRMRAQVEPLLDICIKHPWDDSKQKLNKKEVFEMLFPKQEFLEGKLEKVMVDAYKVVRSFLLINKYFEETNEFHQILDFSEVVRIRGLQARHQQFLLRLKKMQDETLLKNANYFHRQFLLEDALHDNECFHNQVKGDLNVPNTLRALDRHYQLNRLELLNRFFLQQKVANLEIPESIKPILDEIRIPSRYLVDSPLININNEILSLLRKEYPEPLEARNLFDLVVEYENNLDSESLREIYTYLRNISTLVLSKRPEDEQIDFMLHDLFKDNLKRGYLHYEGKLHHSRYWAVSNNAVRVKKFEWALQFIENHKFELIGENESQDIYHFNLANYFFAIGKYSECLENIPATSPFADYLLLGKRLELKAYYELRSDLLAFKLDAFKMFLSRTSPKLLSETQRKINIEFANLLTQIISSLPGDKKRAEILKKRIDAKKHAAEWRWLLIKARDL